MSNPTEDTPNQLDTDFHADAVVCGCHDSRVKTLAPCYLCKNQTKDEQCYKCFKEGQQDDKQLREAIGNIPVSRKTYTDRLDTYLDELAIDRILALFQKEQIQLVSELLEHSREYEVTDLEKLDHWNETPLVAIPASVLEHKKQELEGKI